MKQKLNPLWYGPMEQIRFGAILSHWKIYDESERWSYKNLFRQLYANQSATELHFSQFIAERLNKTHPKGLLPANDFQGGSL